MSPRPYNLGLRMAAAEQTRARIIDAAREILSDSEFDGLSIDAIARQAGVARMTVYYQFGSRRGLLEALYDDIGERGLGDHALEPEASEPRAALDELVRTFTHFWRAERLTIRRLRGLAVIDPEVEAGIKERDQRRLHHVRDVLARVAAAGHCGDCGDDVFILVAGLTSFETYDAIATACRDEARAEEMVVRAVRAVLRQQE